MMKKILLILTAMAISSSVWAQRDLVAYNIEKYPNYANRIKAGYKFLVNRHLAFENDKLEHGFGTVTINGVKASSYTYQDGRVVIVLTSDKPENIAKFDLKVLDKRLKGALLIEQEDKGRVLTEIFNLSNSLFTKSDVETENLEIIQQVKLGAKGATVSFKGPLAILVTLGSTERTYLEEMIFKSTPIEEVAERFGTDKDFKNAYNDMSERRDFINSLILYAKSPYISDIDLAEGVMMSLLSEMEIFYINRIDGVSEQSILLLSNKYLADFLGEVSKGYPELKTFYAFVKEWQGNFAEQSVAEIKGKSSKKDSSLETAKEEFYRRMTKGLGECADNLTRQRREMIR